MTLECFRLFQRGGGDFEECPHTLYSVRQIHPGCCGKEGKRSTDTYTKQIFASLALRRIGRKRFWMDYGVRCYGVESFAKRLDFM